MKQIRLALLSMCFVIVPWVVSAEQPESTLPMLADGPIIVNTMTGPVRVVPIKGLVYPWALAFLPNGDMLVTEQNRTTLRVIKDGALDPTPITGLPPVSTSQRRDTAGVDVTCLLYTSPSPRD